LYTSVNTGARGDQISRAPVATFLPTASDAEQGPRVTQNIHPIKFSASLVFKSRSPSGYIPSKINFHKLS